MRNEIFISFSTEDKELAKMLKLLIENEYREPNLVFLSCVDSSISPIQDPWVEINHALKDAKLIIILATPRSIVRPWLYFEAGGANIKTGSAYIILCAHGLKRNDLSNTPLEHKQIKTMYDSIDLHSVFDAIDNLICKKHSIDIYFEGIINKAKEIKPSLSLLYKQINDLGLQNIFYRKDLIHNGLKWADLFNNCHKSIRVFGWSCTNAITPTSRDIFKKFLIDNPEITLEFLVLDSEAVKKSSDINFGPVCCMENTHNIEKDFKDGMSNIYELIKSITDEKTRNSVIKRITIKKTNWIMTWSGVCVDLEDDLNGLIQIELYLYMINLDYRPELILSNQKDGYFKYFRESINNLWDSGSIINLFDK